MHPAIEHHHVLEGGRPADVQVHTVLEAVTTDALFIDKASKPVKLRADRLGHK